MSDSQFLQVTASILSTLQNSQSFCQPYARPSSPSATALFDTRTQPSSLRQQSSDLSSHVLSMGLSPTLSAEISTILSHDSLEYKSFMEQAQLRLLHELSRGTVSLSPQHIPALVDNACTAFYSRTITSRLEQVRQQIHDLELDDGPASEGGNGSDDDAGSETSESDDGDAQDDDGEIVHEPEEDENAPIKPGEEVPPLETKYLPIFEALHERGKVLTKPEKTYLVEMTGMTYRQITIWFQNRRRGELKENQNRTSASRASSIRSDESTDFSDNELNLDAQLTQQTDTTFNIRSWCLASAIATKNNVHTSSLPPSPTKSGFGPTSIRSDLDSDGDSDLSDTDDEGEAPPGLRVPSLATSVTTVDSLEHGPSTITSGSLSDRLGQPMRSIHSGTPVYTSSRPIKSLPPSRRTPPTALPAAPASHPATAFSFSFSAPGPASSANPQHTAPAPAFPRGMQLVTSDERGLTVELNGTASSTATLQLSHEAPHSTSAITSPGLPSSPASSLGSARCTSSPPPLGQDVVSPRPSIKPLPRRTGCAPRPRPPPRTGPTCASTPANPSSNRSSIVLPPSSNPTLGNTTLGALLRPNPPPPSIPVEMQERLSAVTGRMGIPSSTNSTR